MSLQENMELEGKILLKTGFCKLKVRNKFNLLCISACFASSRWSFIKTVYKKRRQPFENKTNALRYSLCTVKRLMIYSRVKISAGDGTRNLNKIFWPEKLHNYNIYLLCVQLECAASYAH